MASRGEAEFSRLPRFAARAYDWLLRPNCIQARVEDVARFLVSRVERGRLLDVGMGLGWLLVNVHRLNPSIELFGIDISAAMVQQAAGNLKGIPVGLGHGTIRRTDYPSDFFDVVTCMGSFYLWDYPEQSLEEVWRILKSGRSAYLFEADPDCGEDAFRALGKNFRQLDLIRRFVAPRGLRKALTMSYHFSELAGIAERTSFRASYQIGKVCLGGVPMWLRITLRKTTPASANGTRT